jgi:hypothetical protein
MKHQIAEEHGHHMDKMDVTLAPPWNIIDVTWYTLVRQEVKGWYKQFIFPTEALLPFPSSKELSTQAAKQLTHALLNPKPAGPFCQVGDEQMLALQGLAAIFKGALPAGKKNTTSPLCEINDIYAPPRVQITVSPPRVVNGTAPARAVQPTFITSTTPNSHRRLSTPPARAVTPNTPHAMLRRSTHQ